MNLDCTNVKDNRCPFGSVREIALSDENLNLLITGCWGVYCSEGEMEILKYNPELKNIYQKEKVYTIDNFLKSETTIRGQRAVVEKMIESSTKDKINSLFLAGDNIYEHPEPSEAFLNFLNNKIHEWNNLVAQSENNDNFSAFESHFLNKSGIKKLRKIREDEMYEGYKNLRIVTQLEEGFDNCLSNLKVDNIFLALGNHDIETCNILNNQLNHHKGKNLPGLYYNVVYTLDGKNFCNVMVLDTNMFEIPPEDCKGEEYPPEGIQSQVEWFGETIQNVNADWNIVIGHIPYKATGHKKGAFIHNQGLDPIFKIIEGMNKDENSPKVQAYFCADEHNQQYLYDTQSLISLFVVGSGGTELDPLEKLSDETYTNNNVVDVYKQSIFGFAKLSITSEDKLRVEINFLCDEKEGNCKIPFLINQNSLVEIESD